MDIQELIGDSLDRIEHERQLKVLRDTMPAYNAVCMNCGNVIPVMFGDPLYERCTQHKFLDALHLEYCEYCDTRE